MAVTASDYAKRAATKYLLADRAFTESGTHIPRVGPSRAVVVNVTETDRAERELDGDEHEFRELLIYCLIDNSANGIATALVGQQFIKDSEPKVTFNFVEVVERFSSSWLLRYRHIALVAQGASSE